MSIKTLFRALRYDHWRDGHHFAQDILDYNALIHKPFASGNAIKAAIFLWCAKRQPCIYGRYAARNGGIFVSVVTEDDIGDGDEAVAAKIAHDQKAWKQAAIVNPPLAAPHSFFLLVASPRLTYAEPDDNLRQFALHILKLAGWSDAPPEAANPVTSDYLYLRHPTEGTFFGYQYNVDFFAAAGDGRWWRDHRVPGGIAFTANSPGHMRQFQEWYSHSGMDRSEHFVENALYTIAFADQDACEFPGVGAPDAEFDPAADPEQAPMPAAKRGPVTWLRDLGGGSPLRDCPYPFTKAVPPKIAVKDWTSYLGLLHTDHSVRKEFFEDMDSPPMLHQPYVMDFTYLYDRRESDHIAFMQGVAVTIEEIYEKLGLQETWGGPQADLVPAAGLGDEPEQPKSEVELLRVCRQWKADQEIDDPNHYNP